jgi:4-amino-4-deoxychorismate lyase
MSRWYSNGIEIDSIAADDRAAQYGDGLFETIAIRNGKPRFLQAHVARLQTGAARLGLACPGTQVLHEELDAAIEQSGIDTRFATAKLIIAAGRGPRGYRRAADASAIRRIGIFPAQALPEPGYRDGVDIRLCATRLAVQPQLAGIKTLNRLEQVLARAEWPDDAVFEGLMLDTGGRLICGTMSNVFIATKTDLVTPALTRCGVSGIMRGQIIGLLQAASVDCQVRDLTVDEVFAAEEVFLTNSQLGVIPVRRCDAQEWAIGSRTRQVQAFAAANGVPECCC